MEKIYNQKFKIERFYVEIQKTKDEISFVIWDDSYNNFDYNFNLWSKFKDNLWFMRDSYGVLVEGEKHYTKELNLIHKELPPLTTNYIFDKSKITILPDIKRGNEKLEKILPFLYRKILKYQPKYHHLLTEKEKEFINDINLILNQKGICKDLSFVILKSFFLEDLTFDKKDD